MAVVGLTIAILCGGFAVLLWSNNSESFILRVLRAIFIFGMILVLLDLFF